MRNFFINKKKIHAVPVLFSIFSGSCQVGRENSMALGNSAINFKLYSNRYRLCHLW